MPAWHASNLKTRDTKQSYFFSSSNIFEGGNAVGMNDYAMRQQTHLREHTLVNHLGGFFAETFLIKEDLREC
jgi:hypothetical protein